MLRKKVAPRRCGLWTSGFKWREYRDLIKRTFKFTIAYNDHSTPEQHHQPILLAIDDALRDKKKMWELIDNCWIQRCWSPCINKKGAFFCEVAAALDTLLQGPGGYPVEQGWWRRRPEEFRDQVERYCRRCGAALPFSCVSTHLDDPDFVSPSNLARLQEVGSPRIAAGKYQLFDRVVDDDLAQTAEGWSPADYMGVGLSKRQTALGRIIKGALAERKRKKDFSWWADYWLILRGAYSPTRWLYNRRRDFFEKPPPPFNADASQR